MPDNVFELSADGVSYRMLLPNADVDYIQRKLATEHVPYELPMLEDMRTRLSADDLVLDAGANIGNHTMYLAAVVGCRVVAFEPNAKLVAALRASLALNALEGKVDVRELGLGKHAGRGQFAKDIPDNLGAQSITGGDGPLEIVPLDSIDFPSQVKAVKIDVEGMELDVLEGAVGLIQRDRPVLYVECSDQVSFRQVHQWMTAKNYGYWDTFNATPTHLFLPNEQTTVDQRLSRLQLKGAQDIYQLQQQIGKTRDMLDSANLKYRAANEQIANLKVQLTQQETAREKAEQVANDAQGQLAETRNRLEVERTTLQQEVQRLSTLAESHRDAAHNAEKQLIRIEAALEVARAQAAEATAGRNRAEADSERQAAMARALTDKLSAANDQLATTRDTLHEANRKYRVSNEQIQELRRKAEQDDSLAKQAAESAAKVQAGLVESQTRLLEERNALAEQINRLRQDWQEASNGAHQVEKQLVRIEVQLQVEREALAAANTKYREANTRIEELKKRVAEAEQAARSAERSWAEAQAEMHQLKTELSRVTSSHQAAMEQIRDLNAKIEAETGARRQVEQKEEAARAQLAQSQQQYAAARADLDKVIANHRAAIDHVRDLNAKITEETEGRRQLEQKEEEARAQLHRAESQYQAAQSDLEQVRAELNDTTHHYQAATEHVRDLTAKIAAEAEARRQLEQKEEEARAQLRHAESQYQAAQSDLEQVRAELNDTAHHYEAATEHVRDLTAKIAAEIEARRQLEQKEEEARAQLSRTESQYEAAQAELEQVRAELNDTAHHYEAATEQARDLTAKIAAETEARHQLEQRAEEALAELAHARSQYQLAQAELEQVRAELDDTAHNYRTTTEHVRALTEKIAAETEARHQLEQREEEARVELAHARSQYEAAQVDLEQVRTELNDTARNYRTANERVNDLGRQLNDVNLKYRRITSEEIPQLKAKIQSSQAQAREQQHNLAQLKHELATHKKTLKETNHQLERVRQQKMHAEQQVIKTRASLSFQLGYILINGFKSVRGFVGMPAALLAWRKEVIKRRKQKAQRLQKLQPANVTVVQTHTPAVAAMAPQSAEHVAKSEKVAPSVPISTMRAVTELAPSVNQPSVRQALPRDLHHLKVACIMDEFTFGSYRAECDLFQLTPADWQTELESFNPELLFIESAWRGKDELWGNKVGHNSRELQGIVAWCRQRGVPTVFWNKEDPVHFETFLSTAVLFDYVFTTDIDCIDRYKAALKHDNVFLLPFACQPKNNHPIETYERKDAFCFAGAYYTRYPDRTRDLGNFISDLPEFRPVEIYDRNYGKNDPNYQFPPEYQPYIVGTLPFDQIDKAYKGYRYAINLNSIKQSQTMFARRVFELMASNTITVSNFSRGIRLMFGDLVITTDNGHEMVRHLEAVAGDAVLSAKLRLAALRKVLQEHTYEHRLAYVLSKVSGQSVEVGRPGIVILASAANQAELDMLLANFERQSYSHYQAHVLLATDFKPAASTNERVYYVSYAQAATLNIGTIARGADFVAGMLAQDYYGPNYLLDIALATTYSTAEVIGKIAHYSREEDAVTLQAAGTAYRPAHVLALRRAAVRLAKVADVHAASWLEVLATSTLETANGLAIDEFNYCRNGQANAENELVTVAVDDLTGLNQGISIDDLVALAERIPPAAAGAERGRKISGKHLSELFAKAPSAAVRTELDGDNWYFQSSHADGKHEYLYATKDIPLESTGWTDKAEFYFDTTPGLNLQLVIVFLDAHEQKISHVIKHANRNQESDIPLGTVNIRFGLRVYASGSCEIKGLLFGHRNLQPAEIISKADRLILTNHYPSYDDLYRNGFVHSRVKAYREHGIRCDVFRMRPNEPVSYHEFEDVDVTTGPQEVLHQMLSSGRYKTVMVHFLDASMWEVLKHHIDRIRVVVWVHGADIQPWYRRDFNYSTDEERTVAKMKSDARMEFWRGLLRPIPPNLKLVFVSRYFAEEVMEDIGFRIPEQHYTIIHNPIETDLFSYHPKSPEQRKKILSVRPFASAQYANDLSVKAIQLLAEKPWFNDVEFRIIGDGPLFDAVLAPLRQFKNVFIEQRFLKHSEIAALHKEYGIFLCPTRFDSQGVSRDEAMSSGLVPITNAVSAVPEFVNGDCGILAPPESAEALAHGIEELYEKPELFLSMSKMASESVRQQRGKDLIINSEIKVIS